MARIPFHEISADVLPWVEQGEALPETHRHNPEYQAAAALWKVILHPGRNVGARITALKEYFDRTRGKAEEPTGGVEQLDLSKLDPGERAELLRLLKKARPEQKEG